MALDDRSLVIARVLKKYNDIARLRKNNQLTRASLIESLYGDFGVGPDATNRQINAAIIDKYSQYPQLQWKPIQFQLETTGASLDECVAALREGRRLDCAPYVPSIFSKDALTGDVKIAYSEPDGFPFKFHWTATAALDGTITTTKMIIEQPA